MNFAFGTGRICAKHCGFGWNFALEQAGNLRKCGCCCFLRLGQEGKGARKVIVDNMLPLEQGGNIPWMNCWIHFCLWTRKEDAQQSDFVAFLPLEQEGKCTTKSFVPIFCLWNGKENCRKRVRLFSFATRMQIDRKVNCQFLPLEQEGECTKNILELFAFGTWMGKWQRNDFHCFVPLDQRGTTIK